MWENENFDKKSQKIKLKKKENNKLNIPTLLEDLTSAILLIGEVENKNQKGGPINIHFLDKLNSLNKKINSTILPYIELG